MDKPNFVPCPPRRNSSAITAEMASRIKLMLISDIHQHDIAAYFGVNQGRISEINTGMKFSETEPSQGELFPELNAGSFQLCASSMLTEEEK